MSLMMESISEDSRMSASSGGELSNLSPCKTAASTRNATAAVNKQHQALKQRETDSDLFRRRSWFDLIEEEERLEALQKSSASGTKKQTATMDALPSSDSKMSLDESNSSGSSSDRKIEIDILDSANVEKFEKLIRSDKIKSPFKRRLSGEGDEDGDEDGHAEFCEQQQQPASELTEGDDAGGSKGAAPHKHKKTKTHEDDHGRERFRRESTDSGDGSSSQSSRKPVEYEKDVEILVRRQKQIDYGKNTLGYENYMRQVPREQRTKDHPRTPPKHFKYSRRAWDGLVKVWRKQLHCFDPDAKKDGESDD